MKKIIYLLIPFLIGCKTSSEKEDEKIKEHDYSEVSKYEIKWSDMFKVNDLDHYVYCYSLTCHNCKDIKNQVIDKALKKEDKIYFCKEDLNVEDLDLSMTIGASSPDKVFIKGVPSLLKITNKKIEKNILGSKNVVSELPNI